MKCHSLFQQIARAFCFICTCVTIGLASFLIIFSVETIPSTVLWQIPLVSLLIAVTGGLIYHSKRELSKKAYLARNAIHFLILGVILIVAANCFNWFKSAPLSAVVAFAVMTVLIYIFVSVIIYFVKKRQARRMNEKLTEFKEKIG
jgi:cytochrome c-type biogenesis protein CcmH/NrfF